MQVLVQEFPENKWAVERYRLHVAPRGNGWEVWEDSYECDRQSSFLRETKELAVAMAVSAVDCPVIAVVNGG